MLDMLDIIYAMSLRRDLTKDILIVKLKKT
jgi:hypothetical protein